MFQCLLVKGVGGGGDPRLCWTRIEHHKLGRKQNSRVGFISRVGYVIQLHHVSATWGMFR